MQKGKVTFPGSLSWWVEESRPEPTSPDPTEVIQGPLRVLARSDAGKQCGAVRRRVHSSAQESEDGDSLPVPPLMDWV